MRAPFDILIQCTAFRNRSSATLNRVPGARLHRGRENTSRVTDMEAMLTDASFFDQPLYFGVSSVTDTRSMLNGTTALDGCNKRRIEDSLSASTAWPYDWSGSPFYVLRRVESHTAFRAGPFEHLLQHCCNTKKMRQTQTR